MTHSVFPPSTTRSLVVTALVRGADPATRAMSAVRRLVAIVAEGEPDGALDIVLRSTARGGVSIGIRAVGALPLGWDRDVATALEEIAVTARRMVRPPGAPEILTELVRDPARSRMTPAENSWMPGPAVAAVHWPAPVIDDGGLLSTLQRAAGAFVRMLISAPTPLERQMLREEMMSTWERGLHADFDLVYGAPVRVRTFVGSTRRGSFAPLRAAVRSWGTGLLLLPVDDTTRLRFGELAVADLAGFVRPAAWVHAMLRLPAAGQTAPVGIRSVEPPLSAHPLDPVPAADADAITLGTALSSTGRTVAVQMRPADLLRHVWIEGSSGTGKTTLLARMAAELTRRGVGVTLLDPHGQGVDATLSALDPEIAARALVVRHGDPSAPTSVNVMSAGGSSERQATIKSEFIDFMQAYLDPTGSGMVGPRWRRWLSLLWDAVVCVFEERATLLHVISVAAEPERLTRLATAVATRDRELASRLQREIVDLRGDEAANLTAWAVSKFQPLVEHPTMRFILGAGADAVDARRVIDEGSPLLIDLGAMQLGAAGARMLGTIWLLKHWASLGRARRPHVILVDEAHLHERGPLPSFLAEARKFGVGIVLAGQSIDALDPRLRDAVESNVGTAISFRLGLATAGRASARLAGWPASELLRLPDLHAAAALSRAGVPTPPFLLTVADHGLTPDDMRRIVAERELPLLRRWRASAVPPVTDEAIDRGIRAVIDRARRHRPATDVSPIDADHSFREEWAAARRRFSPGSVPTSTDAPSTSVATAMLSLFTEQD